jgi:parvulin-like peptidyl-prolyl isomerase
MDHVVLTVNGEKVLAREYYRRMEFLPNVGTVIGGQFVELPPAFLTLEDLINDRLILQLAKERGVLPTAEAVDTELATRKKESPEDYAKLAELGVSDEELKARLWVELAQFNLITEGVTVTDKQVEEHYQVNKVMYTVPPKVRLRVIVVKTPDDRVKVDEALRSKPFETVAREMSTDLSAFSGGELPEVALSQLPQNVYNEVLRTEAGGVTNWIDLDGFFAKYRVEEKKEAVVLPLDDKLKRDIRRRLMVTIGMNKNDVKSLLDEKRRTAKVEIASPGLQKVWDRFLREYLRSQNPVGKL